MVEISFSSDGYELAGTLTEGAAGEGRIVLMLQGSGPLDRDVNMPHQKLNIFNTLADQFASSGIASFRFDKRGTGQSGGVYSQAGLTEYADDAEAACNMLLSRGYDQIYVLGHSEGTVVAGLLGKRIDLTGLILICPFVTSTKEILRQQARQLQENIVDMSGFRGWLMRALQRIFGDFLNQQEKLIRRIQNSDTDFVRAGMKKLPVRALRELLKTDLKNLFRNVKQPILAIGCGEDIQCPPKDAEHLANLAGTCASWKLLPDLSHILRKTEPGLGFAGYPLQLQHEIDPRVGIEVLKWLQKQPLKP